MHSLKSVRAVASIGAHISRARSSISTKVHQALAISNGLYIDDVRKGSNIGDSITLIAAVLRYIVI